MLILLKQFKISVVYLCFFFNLLFSNINSGRLLEMKLQDKTILKWILILTSIHSFLVGVGLIFVTNQLRIYFGFAPSSEQFFQTQGGVFHIVMSVAYFLGGVNQTKYKALIEFSIIVKIFATVFLLTYFIFINSSILILFSGVTDCLMFLIILIYYKRIKLDY